MFDYRWLDAKTAIESALQRSQTPSQYAEYLSLLDAANRCFVGITQVFSPTVAHPLFMRLGTSDLSNFRQIFVDNEYAFPFERAPTTLLDLGAYVGFAAVYFANRFPNSRIVCVEPSVESFRLLTANTALYKNISRINAAVWSKNQELSASGHIFGDWGAVFFEGRGLPIKALTVASLLHELGWAAPEFLKCDIEGAEKEIFSDRSVGWRQGILWAAVETHDRIVQGSADVVASFFSEPEFKAERSGEYLVFRRDGIPPSVIPPGAQYLFTASGWPRDFELLNVPPNKWAHFFFDEHSFQLQPNQVFEPDAVLACAFVTSCKILRFGIGIANERSGLVTFVVEYRASDEMVAVSLFSRTLSGGQYCDCVANLPRRADRTSFRISFKTKMSETHSNDYAWACWYRPHFANI